MSESDHSLSAVFEIRRKAGSDNSREFDSSGRMTSVGIPLGIVDTARMNLARTVLARSSAEVCTAQVPGRVFLLSKI